ncbi:chitinase [Photobacterium aphoticum]|uniref:Chitinase n=1 Tax=Photobacterium aphoticum TaxID=754436 RepID=A0A090QLH2_9GAMM|nr:chitinase [Photobacterium aphoticum]
MTVTPRILLALSTAIAAALPGHVSANDNGGITANTYDHLPTDTYIVSTTNDYIHYYDKQGQLLLSTQYSLPDASDYLRDLAVTPTGIAVYYGTFDASLAMVYPTHVQHFPYDGLSTVNNGTFGGLAVLGRYAYLTDMETYPKRSKGIVRFDLTDGSTQAFHTDTNYIDITVGGDGLLYALQNVYGDLDILEPVSLKKIKHLDLGHTSSSRAVTANAVGEIFMASWDGNLYQYDQDGVLFHQTLINSVGLTDIDIHPSSELLVTDRDNVIHILDESGDPQNRISQGNEWIAFSAYAEPLRNFPPILKHNTPPASLDIGQTITLDLSGSYDPEGNVLAPHIDTAEGFSITSTDDPLVWTLTAQQAGQHQITITLDDGTQQTRNMFSVNIISKSCDVDPNADLYPEWQPNTTYTRETVSYDGLVWKAKWWNQNQAPSFSGPWQLISEIALPWDTDRQYRKGNTVTYQGQTYQANWWNQHARPHGHPAWTHIGPASDC